MNNNIPTIQQVFDNFDMLYKIIDLMDNSYKMYSGNYLMRYYQNRGITLRDIFTQDMLNWLCFLGWGDGQIDINEVRFINSLLNLNLTQLDVLDIVKGLDTDMLAQLPVTFAIFMEYDSIVNDSKTDIIEALYSSFAIAGTYFIACDGDIHPNEINGLKAYLGILKDNIRTFNLESLHEYMLDNI